MPDERLLKHILIKKNSAFVCPRHQVKSHDPIIVLITMKNKKRKLTIRLIGFFSRAQYFEN